MRLGYRAQQPRIPVPQLPHGGATTPAPGGPQQLHWYQIFSCSESYVTQGMNRIKGVPICKNTPAFSATAQQAMQEYNALPITQGQQLNGTWWYTWKELQRLDGTAWVTVATSKEQVAPYG